MIPLGARFISGSTITDQAKAIDRRLFGRVEGVIVTSPCAEVVNIEGETRRDFVIRRLGEAVLLRLHNFHSGDWVATYAIAVVSDPPRISTL